MSMETTTPAEAARSARQLRIDFLFLDLTSCTRCRGTDRSLGAALAAVADVLRAAGIDVEINKVHVESEQQARAWQLVSSPTIRINGYDIAPELRESSCESACTDACGEQIACRVWTYRGQEYTEPPTELIVDAILRQVYGPAAPVEPSQGYELPENLRRFFAGTHASADRSMEYTPAPEPDCCPAPEQQPCCDAAATQTCCGDVAEPSCGCR